MRKLWVCLAAGTVILARAVAQDGIGDPTFPSLGNRGYRASHYKLVIDYSPDKNFLKADVTMRALAETDLKTLSLDFSGFDISSVKLNGKVVPYARTSAKLRILPVANIPKGSMFSIETVYAGTPVQQQSAALPPGIKSGWIRYEGGAVAVCEPEMSHTWFPCNDHPLNKATFDVEVSTPRPYLAISNGVGTSDGSHRMHYVLDKPGMTCMATVIFGKFGIIKQVGPSSLPITNYVPLGEEAHYLTQLGVTPKFMQYLSDRLGPYPFSTYGAVILPPAVGKVNDLMGGSAIETTSIPVFGPMGATSPETLCHELTHQWMGDCVSVTNWGDDIWWVEGFAQYSEWLYEELAEGKSAYNRAVKGMYDQFATQPHWLKPGHLSAADMFGAGSYVGGGLTFHALRRTLGDDKFFQVIRTFIEKHRFGNGSTADLIATASQVAGRDMKPFFDKWLFGDAIPALPN